MYSQTQKRGPSGGHQGVTLASLLGGGIQNLPSAVRGAQVSPHKPGFIPDVEIPTDRTTDCRACPRPPQQVRGKNHTSDLIGQCSDTPRVSLPCASYCGKPWRALPLLYSHSAMKWELFLCPSYKRGNKAQRSQAANSGRISLDPDMPDSNTEVLDHHVLPV